MHNFLKYVSGTLLSKASAMSDEERDAMDENVEQFMRNCKEVIKVYRTEISSAKWTSKQIKEYQTAVVDLTEEYLKSVCNIYSQQKAIRVRRAVDKQKMSRLESGIQSRSPLSPLFLNSTINRTEEVTETPKKPERGATFQHFAFDKEEGVRRAEEIEITAEEMQLFEKENTALFQEMNALADEVQQIEGSVIEISKLQEIFTDKVLQQEIDLNRVNQTSVNATENVRGGNEQLREAMKKNAGFRVWILFFIITLAFTILFLDWYNP
ncbi:Syntaxin-18-like protein [Leptotrombidium deliense]|uniref:Syntaxin-18 n=1 Tax=Leptotrombidium deliense TaxID=299467 RepID=A0A443SBV7_9ACAR|nr:Syntaxin-18-like protein [Leptotrombidium deliense]